MVLSMFVLKSRLVLAGDSGDRSQPCGIIRRVVMRNAGPASILALILMLAFFPATMSMPMNSGTTPGGCHGHHGPMPPPTHSCCDSHQVPAAVQIARAAVGLNFVAGWLGTADIIRPRTCAVRTMDTPDLCLPLSTVLRI